MEAGVGMGEAGVGMGEGGVGMGEGGVGMGAGEGGGQGKGGGEGKAKGEDGRGGGRGRLPIIAMTASVVAGEREHCLSVGMDDYLAKPVRMSDLGEMIRRWLPADSAEGASGSATDSAISAGADAVSAATPVTSSRGRRRAAG